jgi:hypothetical protein
LPALLLTGTERSVGSQIFFNLKTPDFSGLCLNREACEKNGWKKAYSKMKGET